MRGRGDCEPRVRLAEHVGNTLGRKVRRHRHIGGARLENTQLGHHRRHRTIEQQPDGVACVHTRLLQALGEPAGAALELAVAHLRIAFGKGRRIGRGGGLAAEHLRHIELAVQRGRRRVPCDELLLAVSRGQGADVAQQCVGAAEQVGGRVGDCGQQLLDGCGVQKTCCGVGAKARRVGCGVQPEVKGCLERGGDGLGAEPEKAGRGLGRVCAGCFSGLAPLLVERGEPCARRLRGIEGFGKRGVPCGCLRSVRRGFVQDRLLRAEPAGLQQEPGCCKRGVRQLTGDCSPLVPMPYIFRCKCH